MKLIIPLVLALASLTLTPHIETYTPTKDSCYTEFSARMQVIQALLDEGVLTPKQAAARRKEAFKAYLACLDSIPPGTPD